MSELNNGTYEPQPNQPHQPSRAPKRKRHVGRTVALVVGGLFAVGILAAVLAPGQPAKDTAANTPKSVATVPAVKPTRQAHSPAPKPSITEPARTASQEQAVGAAQQYLELTAFSRKGLVAQLSSDAVGFSKADATYAVDHVTVDWNEQAAASARTYLELTHFSRKGLIEQLESDAVGFTHAQAVYGVTKAGL